MSRWHPLGAPCWVAGPTQHTYKVHCALKFVPYSPWHPKLDQNKKKLGFWELFGPFLGVFPLYPTHFSTKNTQNIHQTFLILLSSPKTQGIVLIPNLLLLGSTLWIWGLGVWCSFLATIHTPNLLNLFSSIYLAIFAWITWFIAFFSMFLDLFVFLA